MEQRHQQARQNLLEWRESQPKNFFTINHQLHRLLKRLMGDDQLNQHYAHFEHFGSVIANELDKAAILNNQTNHLPQLERWSPYGERIEAIQHHPSYHDCGRAIYQEGRIIAVYKDSPANLHAQALFYLSSHVGEAGHNCPVACTAGVVKALQGLGSQNLQSKYLKGLLSDQYNERLDGAQFLTEIQGGSDVGANSVDARLEGDQWRIYGEKWFCSNADADLILMTARQPDGPNGTRGLGLFLVPRKLESGSVNLYSFRRLKDKLGTRSMPSAEIDFNGAYAIPMGEVNEGFKSVMRYVINTSRLYNTLGCAGIARRAYLVADGYARHRRAFGQKIINFPLVQEMLGELRAISSVLLAGGLEVAALADQDEKGTLDQEQQAFLRVATNLIKMRSCQHSHRAVLTGIETLAGNGAIESFSVLPRLLRDNVVYENWEGTHNTLIAQTARDFLRSGLHQGFFKGLRDLVQRAQMPTLFSSAFTAIEKAEQVLVTLESQHDSGVIALLLRPHVETLADVLFAASYAIDLRTVADPPKGELAALELFVHQYINPTIPPRDAQYINRIHDATMLT